MSYQHFYKLDGIPEGRTDTGLKIFTEEEIIQLAVEKSGREIENLESAEDVFGVSAVPLNKLEQVVVDHALNENYSRDDIRISSHYVLDSRTDGDIRIPLVQALEADSGEVIWDVEDDIPNDRPVIPPVNPIPKTMSLTDFANNIMGTGITHVDQPKRNL